MAFNLRLDSEGFDEFADRLLEAAEEATDRLETEVEVDRLDLSDSIERFYDRFDLDGFGGRRVDLERTIYVEEYEDHGHGHEHGHGHDGDDHALEGDAIDGLAATGGPGGDGLGVSRVVEFAEPIRGGPDGAGYNIDVVFEGGPFDRALVDAFQSAADLLGDVITRGTPACSSAKASSRTCASTPPSRGSTGPAGCWDWPARPRSTRPACRCAA